MAAIKNKYEPAVMFLAGKTPAKSWTKLQYDSETGAAQYVEAYWGGYFELKAFLEQAHRLCNCYDQAGVLQTLTGALGIDLTWIYMDPFGYIDRTSSSAGERPITRDF